MSNENTIFVEERLALILEACQIIQELMNAVSKPDDFVASSAGIMRMDSLALRLQTIGENVKKIERIAPETLEQTATINWNLIIRFRDMMAHHYEKTDYEVLFDICTNHIPVLATAIGGMLENIRSKQ